MTDQRAVLLCRLEIGKDKGGSLRILTNIHGHPLAAHKTIYSSKGVFISVSCLLLEVLFFLCAYALTLIVLMSLETVSYDGVLTI